MTDDVMAAAERLRDWAEQGGQSIYGVRQLTEDASAVLAELHRLRAAVPVWRPIAEAPRDGTEVWVYAPPYQELDAITCCAAYHPNGGWCVDELRYPTHWQPLPSPPGPRPPTSAWQPIETLPPNWEGIVSCGGAYVTAASNYGGVLECQGIRIMSATHWQALPPPAVT